MSVVREVLKASLRATPVPVVFWVRVVYSVSGMKLGCVTL